jgi:hypothetical protein
MSDHRRKSATISPAASFANTWAAADLGGRKDDAWSSARLSVDAATAEPWGLLASALNRLGEHVPADVAARRALKIDPDNPYVWVCLGQARDNSGASGEAIAAYQKALSLDRDNAPAHMNLCSLLYREGRYLDALEHGRRALALSPSSALTNFYLSRTLGKLGLWNEFWRCYEWRWLTTFQRTKVHPVAKELPYWRGEDISGKRIVLWTEQGDGDTIMFARYVHHVAARRPAELFLACPRPLSRLFASLPCRAHRRQPADYHCPLMSLPLALDLPHPFGAGNYLGIGRRHPDNGPIRVGLKWAGRPGHFNDHLRSLPVTAFEPLRRAGCQFISLHYDDHGPSWMEDGLAGSRDYADTAAVVATLDVVITVDTSIAHLAGAIGVPVLVILPPRGVDWRWGTEGEETAWYPSMRLLRHDGIMTAARRLDAVVCSGRTEAGSPQ